MTTSAPANAFSIALSSTVFSNPTTNGLNLQLRNTATVNVDRPSANAGNSIQVGNLDMGNASLGVAGIGATPTFSGGKKTLVVKLKPGTYTFFCSVPGHRQAGMQGTLTVS